jgi:hypothetical protein
MRKPFPRELGIDDEFPPLFSSPSNAYTVPLGGGAPRVVHTSFKKIPDLVSTLKTLQREGKSRSLC